jgi:hypothetical protein
MRAAFMTASEAKPGLPAGHQVPGGPAPGVPAGRHDPAGDLVSEPDRCRARPAAPAAGAPRSQVGGAHATSYHRDKNLVVAGHRIGDLDDLGRARPDDLADPHAFLLGQNGRNYLGSCAR